MFALPSQQANETRIEVNKMLSNTSGKSADSNAKSGPAAKRTGTRTSKSKAQPKTV